MRPALVMPFHDPEGIMLPHLEAILPVLKTHFEQAFLTITEATERLKPENVSFLREQGFFRMYPIASESPIGNHFAYLYRHAAMDAHAEQILHLCYLDRLAFALRMTYREQFLADIGSIDQEHLPLIFQRSEKAWASHPRNYFELEGFVTAIGQNLFNRTLDYGWCHFVIQAEQLRELMPKVKNPDLSMVAEMILHTQENIHTREVDWLAREDPFIHSRVAEEFKVERENSLEEMQKRVSYVMPMVETMIKFSKNGKG